MPYFHIGSEAQSRIAPDFTFKNSMYLAYYSHLPLIASSGARTSKEEARKQVQSISLSYFKKEAKVDYPSKKPILILYAGDSLLEDEKQLLSMATPYYKFDNFELLILDFDQYFKFDQNPLIKIKGVCSDSITVSNQKIYLSKDSSLIYYNGFDEIVTQHTFSGRGSFVSRKNNYDFIFNNKNLNINLLKDSNYVFTCWYYNFGEAINLTTLFVEEYDQIAKKSEYIATRDVSSYSEIIGNWTHLELKFKPKVDNGEIRVFIHGSDPNDKFIYIDEALILKENTHACWEKSNKSFVDNILLIKK